MRMKYEDYIFWSVLKLAYIFQKYYWEINWKNCFLLNCVPGVCLQDIPISVTDDDVSAEHRTYKFTLSGDNHHLFVINSSSGLVTVKEPGTIDCEVNAKFTLTVWIQHHYQVSIIRHSRYPPSKPSWRISVIQSLSVHCRSIIRHTRISLVNISLVPMVADNPELIVLKFWIPVRF